MARSACSAGSPSPSSGANRATGGSVGADPTPAVVRAQGGAARPIRFVVPFAAGGLTDIATRLVAQHMSQTLEQTIVVDNRPGGNQIIATEAVARAPKDGLTVLVGGTAGLPLNALMRPNLPYALEDFAPVALVADPLPLLWLAVGVGALVARVRRRG